MSLCIRNNTKLTARFCLTKRQITSSPYTSHNTSQSRKPQRVATRDSELLIGNEVSVPLAYTLLHNLPQKFKLLHETFGASFAVMETFFKKRNQSAMHVICERGYVGILEYYLPHYLSASSPFSLHEEYTIEFTRTNDQYVQSQMTPIQVACLHKRYPVLSFLLNYFDDPPIEFDINYQDEASGNCCVLIAAR